MARADDGHGVARHDHTYCIAIGSNQRHPVFGRPRDVVASAMEILHQTLGTVTARSPIVDSAPVGPSQRRYANAAVMIDTRLNPLSLLACLHEAEAAFGRVRRGQIWRTRTLDLDIVLWSGGIFAVPELLIPHPQFRGRDFVLSPAAAIAPGWKDPITGFTLRQLHARLTRSRPALR